MKMNLRTDNIKNLILILLTVVMLLTSNVAISFFILMLIFSWLTITAGTVFFKVPNRFVKSLRRFHWRIYFHHYVEDIVRRFSATSPTAYLVMIYIEFDGEKDYVKLGAREFMRCLFDPIRRHEQLEMRKTKEERQAEEEIRKMNEEFRDSGFEKDSFFGL